MARNKERKKDIIQKVTHKKAAMGLGRVCYLLSTMTLLLHIFSR